MPIWFSEIKELELLLPSIKGRFPDLEKELEQLIETKDANVILIYSRRCLEVIITDLCEIELKRPRKTEPLKGIIDKLSREEIVPSDIIASMQYLNSLSTFGAHPKDFNPEQVKPVLSNLAIIIKWYLKYKTGKAKAEAEAEEGYELHGAGYKGEKVQGVDSQEGRQAEIDTQSKGYKETGALFKYRKNPFIVVSGILIFIIILLLIFDPFHFFRKDKFEDIRDPEGKISIAVMPFENLTGDTTLNWFQRGISSLIINGLGNSLELAVRDDHTMFEVMESMNQVYTAGISPSVAKEVAEKVKAETYISGSFQGREDTYWILVNLVNTGSGEIIWTNKIEGNLKSSGYLVLADSLCDEIKNYLEIKALENVADFDFREAYTNSAEAYRYFIEGLSSILTQNYESGIKSLKKALEIDSAFTFASFYIAYAYSYSNQVEESYLWTKKAYASKERIPPKYQPWLELWYACSVSKDLQDIIRYCNLLEKSGIESRLLWFDLGVTYQGFPQQYEKAVEAFEKVEEISLERGGDWEYELYYDWYLYTLHKVGKHDKEKEISEIGLKFFPDSWRIIWNQAVCALSMGDTTKANELIEKFRSIRKEEGRSESVIERDIGIIFKQADIIDKAEVHLRKAYELERENVNRIFNLAYHLIKYDINVYEGMEMVQKGLEINPDDLNLLAVKGLGYHKLGKYEEALQLYKMVDEKFLLFNYELYQLIQEAEQALANQNK
jgi:tetratricopeptide (TPR) repeat protein